MTTAVTTTNTTDLSLDGLATRINEAHRECESAARSAVDQAVRAGELLIEAKGKVGHGSWLQWMGDNCECSARTAQRYMTVARNRDLIAKTTRVADLGVGSQAVAKADGNGQPVSINAATRLIHEGAKIRQQETQEKLFSGPPPSLRPEPTDATTTPSAPPNHVSLNGTRKRRLLRHEEKRAWMVEVGPNHVGWKLDEYLTELEEHPERYPPPRTDWKAERRKIDELRASAAEAKAEAERKLKDAERLEKAAQEAECDLRRAMRDHVEAKHGEAFTHVESTKYFVEDEELDEHLKTMSTGEIIEYLINSEGEPRIRLGDRNYWGDMRKFKFSQIRPAGDGAWNGVGLDGWGMEGKDGSDRLWN